MYYRATITNSLKVAESRIIADLMLRGCNVQEWQNEVMKENVLQVGSPETAKRLSSLLRARLHLMQPTLWEMVRDGSSTIATQACFAAAVKHSPVLGDFLDLTVREQYLLYRRKLSFQLWDHFIEDCHSRDAGMSDWSESTIIRIRTAVFAILAQAKYIENTRTLKLQNVNVVSEVLNYLHQNNEQYVLRCIEVQP